MDATRDSGLDVNVLGELVVVLVVVLLSSSWRLIRKTHAIGMKSTRTTIVHN